MPTGTYAFTAKLWRHDGPAPWFFVALPKAQAREIRMVTAGVTGRGWGSIRVQATVGATTWATSIFPSKERGTYLLPVKAEVRAAEGLGEGRAVHVRLAVLGGDGRDGP